jgi:DNA-binding MarR family transcriptional regulator
MRPPDAGWTTNESAVGGFLRHWHMAMRWRQVVDKELKRLGLSFNEWLVLECTRVLVREFRDAVNQNQVAHRAGLDRMTVSRAMGMLDRRNLVSRGPDMYCTAYRVFVTEEGRALAAQCSARITAASARFRRS